MLLPRPWITENSEKIASNFLSIKSFPSNSVLFLGAKNYVMAGKEAVNSRRVRNRRKTSS